MDSREARDAAAEFAATRQGPAGPLKLQRHVGNHLALFEALIAAGATWTQIARLMAEVGVVGKNSAAISAESWRTMVARAIARKPHVQLQVLTKPLPQSPSDLAGGREATPPVRDTPVELHAETPSVAQASTAKPSAFATIKARMRASTLIRRNSDPSS